MTTREPFNDLARRAATVVPLGGTTRTTGIPPFHWRVRLADGANLLQRLVYVGAGTVNEQVAAITYRRTGDPRGWEMPADYPGLAQLTKWFGPDFNFVDRSLLEDDPPFLLLTLPDPSSSSSGFKRVADTARPRAFWSEADWQLDLWMASVYLSALSFRADPSLASVPSGVRPPNQPARFRVFAGQLPASTVGTEAGGTKEIARIWLLRDPNGVAADDLRIQQLAFWSLRCRAVSPFVDLGFGPASGGDGDFLTGLTGLVGSLVEGTINALLTDLGGIRWWNV